MFYITTTSIIIKILIIIVTKGLGIIVQFNHCLWLTRDSLSKNSNKVIFVGLFYRTIIGAFDPSPSRSFIIFQSISLGVHVAFGETIYAMRH